MNINIEKTVFITLVIFLVQFMVITGQTLSEDTDGVVILNTEEIKVEGEEEAKDIVSLEEVEESRALTKERIYGLMFLWFLIIVCIVLLKYQARDDEKLYKAGYYNDSK